ncbi:MAG TPA: hypothetical protein VLW65_06555 [Bryobacteraceae bacterium]|nr:hypothetical protein [Bryobacteraceae bacterium]
MSKRRYLSFAFLSAMAAYAQQPVAPTPEPVGSPRGENYGDYNITNSFETGYRWSLVDGNIGMYKADVNYGNGVRLLGSNLTIDSKDGHGNFFDQILLNTIGLGNDPYEAVHLRIQKNGLYRYDMLWRLDDFYNPGLTISGGEHFMNTERRLQDHDLVLFPQSKIQLDLGYSRNTQSGPELSTVQLFDTQSSAFPVFANVRRSWNEYRLGATVEVSGFRLIVRRTWDFYKDDTPYSLNGVEGSGVPGDLTVLNQFQRFEPYHGSNPGWLGNLYSNRKRWAMNARITYVSGSRDFALDEMALGANRFGAAANRQIFVNGNGARPSLAGDFSISWFPTEQLTIVNNTSVYNTRINGNSYFTEYDNGTGFATTLNFNFLGVRTIANATDVKYSVNRWLGVYAGYNYSARQIRDQEAFSIPSVPGTAASDYYEQDGHLNAGTLGIRLKPWQPLTINLEGEGGYNNRPLTPIAEGSYRTLGGRVQYRTRRLQLGANYRELYNENAPLNFLTYSSRSRQTSVTGSWSPQGWFSIDGSYTKLHLDTVGGLAFFAGVGFSQLQTGFNSIYISNIHAGNLAMHFALRKRADLYIGYSITKDTGDGRASAVSAGVTDPVGALLSSVQTFPLTYQSPMARVSVRISPKIRWNVGYQFYGYGQQFQLLGYYQNYNAHTGYSSLLWSF